MAYLKEHVGGLDLSSGDIAWIRNPPGVLLVLLLPVGILAGTLIALPGFLEFFPLPVALIPVVAGIALGAAALRTWVFLEVGLGEDTVILKGILRKEVLCPLKVAQVTLDPPVTSDDLSVDWWGKKRGELDSLCTIRTREGREIRLVAMPNGLKLRIARILDPEHFPTPSDTYRMCNRPTIHEK
jgi:hypothetical protein